MIIDNFMNSLKALIAYKIKNFIIENEDVSLYGDIRSAYDSDKKGNFELYKKQYIDYLNNNIKIDTFELKLLDVEFDELKSGDLRFKYMLDIASLFESYDENLLLPFYTMLKVNAVLNSYNNPLVINLNTASDLDIALLNRTKPELLSKAANDLGKELTFLTLTAS